MSITLDQIKSLRDKTGISISTCKKALEEANGDEALAIDILRKKGEAKALERSDRTTSQGVIAISMGSGKAAMLALGCETDFVAKNEDFVMEAQKLADRYLNSSGSDDFTVDLQNLNIKMGEKIALVNQVFIDSAHIYSYLHSNRRIGVLVSFSACESEEIGRDVAMHVAAARPQTLSPDEVANDLVEKEKVIWQEQLKQEGKPEAIWSKILEGKEKKYREEWALLTQAFVKSPDQTVAQMLGGSKIDRFIRFEV